MRHHSFHIGDLKKYFYHPFFAPALTICFVVFPLINWFQKAETAEKVIFYTDNHITIGLYVIALVAAYFYRPKDNTRIQNINFWIIECVILGALLRELGIQHWFSRTDSTAIKIRFFLNPNNPISEKIVVGLFLLMWLAIAIHLLRRYTFFMIREFFRFNTVAWTLATLCIVTVVSKFIDRYPDNYQRFTGSAMSPFWKIGCTSFEEIYEAYIPVLIIIAVIQFAHFKIRVGDRKSA